MASPIKFNSVTRIRIRTYESVRVCFRRNMCLLAGIGAYKYSGEGPISYSQHQQSCIMNVEYFMCKYSISFSLSLSHLSISMFCFDS